MKVTIIGVGLLGGSFGMSIKKVMPDAEIIGVDINPIHIEQAMALQVIDKSMELQEALACSKLVVLATPVNIIEKKISGMLDMLPDHAILVDLGSTKEKICRAANGHPKRGRYIALHPIAGTENSGPEAATADLLCDKIMIVCDKERSNPEAVAYIEELLHKIGMHIRQMDAKEHDLHLAYVSHLSHITSFALGVSVLEKEKNDQRIFDMAGSGFSSTVRLAKSAPSMWVPIFGQNKENISQALGSYIEHLQNFKSQLDSENNQEMREFITNANKIRKVLDKKK